MSEAGIYPFPIGCYVTASVAPYLQCALLFAAPTVSGWVILLFAGILQQCVYNASLLIVSQLVAYSIACALASCILQNHHAAPPATDRLDGSNVAEASSSTCPLHTSERGFCSEKLNWLYESGGNDELLRDLVERNSEERKRGLPPIDRFLSSV